MATNVGNYLIEVDGVAVCLAQEVETGGIKHEPVTIYRGDQPNPVMGRGKFTVEEVKIKQARGISSADSQFSTMFQNYVRGIDMTKPNVRIVTLDEDGITPIATDDYTECVVTSFVPDGKKAEGKEADHFTIAFKPTDHFPVY